MNTLTSAIDAINRMEERHTKAQAHLQATKQTAERHKAHVAYLSNSLRAQATTTANDTFQFHTFLDTWDLTTAADTLLTLTRRQTLAETSLRRIKQRVDDMEKANDGLQVTTQAAMDACNDAMDRMEVVGVRLPDELKGVEEEKKRRRQGQLEAKNPIVNYAAGMATAELLRQLEKPSAAVPGTEAVRRAVRGRRSVGADGS